MRDRSFIPAAPMSRRQVMQLGGTSLAGAILRARSLDDKPSTSDLKIDKIEFTELTGHYQSESGLNNQYQVNPLDVYDDLRRSDYKDHPGAPQSHVLKAIYLRIHTRGGAFGLYGPIDIEPAVLVNEDLRSFLIGKDALAGETLWDEMYRSNRHSRDGIFMMAISAIDNALWDLRGRVYNVPVYRLLGGPTRNSIEAYASCLGFSLEPEAVRTRCLQLQKEGYRYQKWFIAYGPGSGPNGMHKNVELVRILRETLGDDTELMFDDSHHSEVHDSKRGKNDHQAKTTATTVEPEGKGLPPCCPQMRLHRLRLGSKPAAD